MSLFSTFNGIVGAGGSELIQSDVFSTVSTFLYNVPAGTTHLLVKEWGCGAGGGLTSSSGQGGIGGSGAFLQAVIVPGLDSSYYIDIGPGGLAGGPDRRDDTAKGGGIVRFYKTSGDNIAVVGSGGAGGNGNQESGNKNGGDGSPGGGPDASDGGDADGSLTFGNGGKGATQSGVGAGGLGGIGDFQPGDNGASGSGTNGGAGGAGPSNGSAGGDGGDGFFGGGGGGQGGHDSGSGQGGDGAGGGGAGGSSSIDFALATSPIFLSGSGNLPPNTSDPDYIPGMAEGGLSDTNGTNGIVVIQAWAGFPEL